MTSGPEESERVAVAAELRAMREAARESAGPRRPVLPEAHATRTASTLGPVAAPPTEPPLELPSGVAVNALWEARPEREPGGLRGFLARLLRRVLAPWHHAQVAFNSRQVQLDNALLEYITARFDRTHRHYDGVLGAHGKRLEDVDERHLILQEELVAHVHDLVRRIDLVLGESERGRLGLEAEVRALRERVRALEERLAR